MIDKYETVGIGAMRLLQRRLRKSNSIMNTNNFRLVGLLLAGTSLIAPVAAHAYTMTTTIPAGTQIRFHLDSQLSSNGSKTGQRFTFTMLDPIAIGDRVVVPSGSVGQGTVLLAGPAAWAGHEGDLTLQLDSVQTATGQILKFTDQRLEVNGPKFRGSESLFHTSIMTLPKDLQGHDVTIDTNRTLTTDLTSSATVVGADQP